VNETPWPHRDLSRYVEAGGVRWHVQQAGHGEPLLLVHGTGASTHSWRDVLPILAENHAVLAVDLPGHGFSSPLAGVRSSIEGMSESLAALLRALGISPKYCVGHSAGAVILCRLALDRHISPSVIISLNGAFLPLGGAPGMLLLPMARLLASTPLLPHLISLSARNPATVARAIAATGSRLDETGVEFYVRLLRDPRHVAGMLRMMGNWNLYAFERELPRLTTSLVLMVAANDRTVPPHQALTVQRRVPNAVIHRLGNLGHLAHEEQPGSVALEILKVCRAA
jgi:magnesium chelatase accessory protein